MKFGLFIRSLLALLAAFLGAMSAHADIVIAQVAPFSGPLAPTGTHMRAGAQLYIDAVNVTGGISGTKLKLISRDDGYQAAETVRLVKESIREHRPVAFLGIVGTGNIEALLKEKVFESAGIALVGFRSGAKAIAESGNPWLFMTRATYAEEVGKILHQYIPLGYKRIAVLYQDDPFGQDGLAAARTLTQESGGELVAAAPYEKNTVKVESAVKTIGAANPSLVIMVSNTAASAEFVKQFRATGNLAQLVSLSTTDAAQLVDKIGKKAAHGVVITQVVPAPSSVTAALAKEVRDACMRAALKDISCNHTVVEGYLGAKVLVEAIRRAGPGGSSKQIRDALESLRGYDAGGIEIGFTANRHVGSRYVDITIINSEGNLVR